MQLEVDAAGTIVAVGTQVAATFGATPRALLGRPLAEVVAAAGHGGMAGEADGIAVVAAVGHELRSPLTSIRGYTSLLLHRWDRLGDDDKTTMLGQIRHDAERVTRLINELLDISRLETGRLALRRERVDLADVAERVVDKVAMAYPDLQAEVDRPKDLPRVFADPDKVEQARAKPTLAGWFVGQVMKATGGKANPQAVNQLVKAKLGLDD